MQQLEIQFFFPLTEQIPLDLNFAPCIEYSLKKKKEKNLYSGSVLTTDGISGATWSTVNVLPNTFAFRAEPNAIGYWEVSPGVQVWRDVKPHWLHQKLTKIFFGWEWKNK